MIIRIPGLFIILLAVSALAIYLVINFSVVKQLEQHAFQTVQTKGNGVIYEAQKQIASAESLARALAAFASTIDQNTPSIPEQLISIIDSNGNRDLIAGGGIWPEPFALDPNQSRNSFFWGRDNESNQLVYYDSYNDPQSMGYHHEEWYVPVKYLPENRVYWSRSYIDPYSMEPMITCSVPIRKNEEFWGVATIDIKLSGVNQIFRAFSKAFEGWVFVLTSDGSILSFPEAFSSVVSKPTGGFMKIDELKTIYPDFTPLVEQIGKLDEKWLGFDADTKTKILELSNKLARESYQISDAESKLIAVHILNEQTSPTPEVMLQEISTRGPIQKKEAVITVQSIPETQGKLITILDYHDLKQNTLKLYKTLSYLFVALVASMIVLSVVILHRTFMRPLSSIKGELTKAIHDNDKITSTLTYDREDELGVLAKLFNARTEKLNSALEQLTKAKEKEQKANQAKGEFLTTMTHEIRTPLHGISGYSNLLVDTELSGEQEEFARAIIANTSALMGVIEKILDFSKIESNKLEIEKHPFSIRKCIVDLTDLVAPQADAKGLHFSVKVSDRVPSRIIGDLQRLRQVLLNLCSNAVKFTSRGYVSVEIDAEYESEKVVLTFQVKDSGIGIPENLIEYLFQPFTQADSSTTRKFGGSGLGLAISKRLIEAMDGVICIDSTPGKGSCFAFNIKADPCTTHEILNEGAPSERIRDYNTWGNDFPLDILVAEDNPTNRKLIARILTKMHYHPDFAEDGKVVMRMVEAKKYDLILMDNLMPEMDGIEASVAIRKGHAGELNQNTTIVAVTANAFEDTRKQCLEAGMDGFLSKPVKISELAETLEIAHNHKKKG